jgi:hypothetical protein
MSAATTVNGAANSLGRRPRNTAPIGSCASKDAKRLAAVILEVLAGMRTPPQAAVALHVSLPRYYQLEARGLRGLLGACEPRPKGRQANPATEVAALQRENERLQRDLTRQQSLVRVTQRSVGLSPPPPPRPSSKSSGKKTRKRKPIVRALSMAARLQQEAAEAETPSAPGSSSASE